MNQAPRCRCSPNTFLSRLSQRSYLARGNQLIYVTGKPTTNRHPGTGIAVSDPSNRKVREASRQAAPSPDLRTAIRTAGVLLASVGPTKNSKVRYSGGRQEDLSLFKRLESA